jgi:hypothetical protein
MSSDQALLQGEEGGGLPDTLLYSALALAGAGEPASWNTDLLVYYLLGKQHAEGNWRGAGASRAPIQDGDISRTAMAVCALTVYGTPNLRSQVDDAIARAGRWLSAQTPVTTEDRTMQLLGLKWAATHGPIRKSRTGELVAQQRANGGWAQTPFLPTDAYATGQVLYTLHQMGVPSSDPVFQRGVEYLLGTQRDDGSWYVKSRAMKVQPFFESGFPHGHDQWISSAATAWATMALTFADSDELSTN